MKSKENLQKRDKYETYTVRNNSSLSNPYPKSVEEKLQYVELAVNYRDINPVYNKLSK